MQKIALSRAVQIETFVSSGQNFVTTSRFFDQRTEHSSEKREDTTQNFTLKASWFHLLMACILLQQNFEIENVPEMATSSIMVSCLLLNSISYIRVLPTDFFLNSNENIFQKKFVGQNKDI